MVHIIAEAGSNYNGSVPLAFKLNDCAVKAGADSVKYQVIYPEGLYRPGQYPYGHYDIKEVIKIREDAVLDDEDWLAVCLDARDRGIDFSASIFDRRGLELLCRFEPRYIKIASCDLNNLRFLRMVAERNVRMVVSTGMASLSDIEKAVVELDRAGVSGEKLVLLHCVSVYPSLLKDTNLNFIRVLRRAFGTDVGFSDHTLTTEAACVAVSLGASWIEKHFTLDKSLPGLDHKYAMDSEEFSNYVATIRATEEAVSPTLRKLTVAERDTRCRARRGVYVAKDLPAGHVLGSDDIAVLRPESEIAADKIDEIVGATLLRNLAAYEALGVGDLVWPEPCK